MEATEWGSKLLALLIETDGKPHDFKGAIVVVICELGLAAWADGDDELAARRGAEGLALALEAGVSRGAAHHLLAKVALSRGDLAQAEEHLKQLRSENINIIMNFFYGVEIQYPIERAVRLRLVGLLAGSRGQFAQAATLFGAIQDWEARIPGYYCPRERAEYDTALAGARAALGESAFTAAWQEGQALALEQAVALAQEVLNG